MNLNEFCFWVISNDGWGAEIEKLSKLIVYKDFPLLQVDENISTNTKIDWSKLLLISSILSQSEEREHLETALLIAQSGILLSESNLISNSSLIVLNQLRNNRTAVEAINKGHILNEFLPALGVSARMLAFKEEMDSKIFSAAGEPISANKFQIDFWNSANDSDWVYALAPTASGKSYIVLKFIVEKIKTQKAKVIVYIAPTRALVSEIEQNLREHLQASNMLNVSVSSIPIKELINTDDPCIYVFTQERLHIFLNTSLDNIQFDLLIVDEIQKLNDGMRGVILQDAIERVLRISETVKIVYLSPNAENPEFIFRDKPSHLISKIVDRDQPMVNQNMIWASQRHGNSTKWKLELKYKNSDLYLGDFDIKDRPTTIAKKMAFVAFGLTGNNSGTMVYANEPSEAEDIAEFLAELLEPTTNENLDLLSNLARDGVHRNFKLVNTVKKGVAFHYGNMPSLLREEIENAFNKGDIKYLICTSTLIEGVNLSCKTIFVHGPKRGKQTPMSPQDFWNLAGRAGRWGKEFQGNIVCIDPQVWKIQPPERRKFILKRQTDETLRDSQLEQYILARTFDTNTINEKNSYESVLAYLINEYIREGSLTSTQFRNHYETSYLDKLQANLATLRAKIDIPRNIIEKHSGISAISMQTLLDYFRKSYGDGKKPIQKLIPLTPEADGAYDNMEGILRRIHKKLYPGFGFGYQYKHYAVLILNWMQGHSLNRLIIDAIRFNREEATKSNKKEKSIHTIIRDTMKEVEEFARFKAPKYISCYADILKIFLAEQNQLSLYPTDYPFDLFLEFGVMSQTLLSLIGIGLSRMTAIEIGNVILSSDLDKEACLNWLNVNLMTKDIPEFAKKEAQKKLKLQAA